MSWTAPKTWVPAELVTATELNTYIRDNQLWLKSRPTNYYILDESSNIVSTTATTWEDIDSTNWSLSLTTTGGNVIVYFVATVKLSTTSVINFDFKVDGTRYISDDGIGEGFTINTPQLVSYTYLVPGLSAASHTFVAQWYGPSATRTLYAGNGAYPDHHPIFFVREV